MIPEELRRLFTDVVPHYRCTKCLRQLPHDAFAKRRSRARPVAYWCRECYSKWHTDRYTEVLAAKGKKWRESKEGKEYVRMQRLSRRLGLRQPGRNRGARKAAATFRSAIKDGPCSYCGRHVSVEAVPGSPTVAHVDHVVPRARGGSDRAENKQLLCPACNQAKWKHTELEFFRHIMQIVRHCKLDEWVGVDEAAADGVTP